MDLEALVLAAERRLVGLCPLGGCRWTPEDGDSVRSILFELSQTEPFRRAQDAGLTPEAARAYLLKALRNRLLKAAIRDGRVRLAGDGVYEAAAKPLRGLDPEDADTFSSRVWGRLPATHRDECVERLLGIPIRGYSPSKRTKEYRWAEVQRVLKRVVDENELTLEEGLSLMQALVPRLQMWQREREREIPEKSENPLRESTPLGIVSTEGESPAARGDEEVDSS